MRYEYLDRARASQEPAEFPVESGQGRAFVEPDALPKRRRWAVIGAIIGTLLTGAAVPVAVNYVKGVHAERQSHSLVTDPENTTPNIIQSPPPTMYK
jgi:hypothetical protein